MRRYWRPATRRFQNKSGKLDARRRRGRLVPPHGRRNPLRLRPGLRAHRTEPKEPLCFFNMEGHPGATLLIWEHTLDSNGKPCSNPRAIVPRWDVPNIVKEPVEVDVRSFGVRMPLHP